LKFEVYTADANGVYLDKAPLNDFTIDSAVDAELIEISIAGDSSLGHAYGASTIARMNLRDGNFGSCVLTGLKISGDLSTTDDALLDEVEGDIYVGGKLNLIEGIPDDTYDLKVGGRS